MARYFLDTFAVVKLYRTEPNSPAIRRLIAARDEMVVAETMRIEYRSAIGRLVRQGTVSPAGSVAYLTAFDADRQSYDVVELNADILRDAERLLDRHSVSHRLRTLDSLQLACALAAP